MGLRAGGTAKIQFFGLGKLHFLQGDLSALIRTAGRPLINKRRPRRVNMIKPRVFDCAFLALVQRLAVFPETRGFQLLFFSTGRVKFLPPKHVLYNGMKSSRANEHRRATAAVSPL